ncbi:hypothetical protein BC827DRAFT_1158968 [Russula dissimulans]|nr:hypothetical protein BC827DRAFT_1158968 [Russula dissimulans]
MHRHSHVIEQENPAFHPSEYSRAYMQQSVITVHPNQGTSWLSVDRHSTIQPSGPEPLNADPGSEYPTVPSSVASFRGNQLLGPQSPSLSFLSRTTPVSPPIRQSSPATTDSYEACRTRNTQPAYSNVPDNYPQASPPSPPQHFPRVPVSAHQSGTSSEIYTSPPSVVGFTEDPLFQDDPTSSCGKLLGATYSPAVIQEHNRATQKMSRQREQKAQVKRERDKTRKRKERSTNLETYTSICELLEIRLTPQNTLANRILEAVENLVEQRKLLCDLKRQLDEAETQAAALRGKLAQRPP